MKLFIFGFVMGLLYQGILPTAVGALPSENVVIAQVQTGGSATGTTGEEYILLWNNSTEDINITNWCLNYSSASNGETFQKKVCVEPPDELTELWLKADGFVSFATPQFFSS